jgi:hypothetical protein
MLLLLHLRFTLAFLTVTLCLLLVEGCMCVCVRACTRQKHVQFGLRWPNPTLCGDQLLEKHHIAWPVDLCIYEDLIPGSRSSKIALRVENLQSHGSVTDQPSSAVNVYVRSAWVNVFCISGRGTIDSHRYSGRCYVLIDTCQRRAIVPYSKRLVSAQLRVFNEARIGLKMQFKNRDE